MGGDSSEGLCVQPDTGKTADLTADLTDHQVRPEKLTLCLPGLTGQAGLPSHCINQSSVQPGVGRDDPADTAITTEATRSPPAPVRGGFTSDKTPRTTRKPFTAFNNFNIPI